MIIRNVDTAGRIIIPSEMLHELDLHKLDKVVITLEGNYIKLSKYAPKCFFCGSQGDLVRIINNRDICHDCISKMNDLVFDNPKCLTLNADEESAENSEQSVADTADSADSRHQIESNKESGKNWAEKQKGSRQ